MENEEQILRNHPGDFMMPADPFTNSVGHFWGILDTRDYMRARFALVRCMGVIQNVQSIQAQLDHLMDMLRLCRSDNMGVRHLVPGLMLRLHKDQECYDFIKWWAVVSANSQYDWGDTDLPYLDIKNADVFESVEPFRRKFPDLSHLVCLALLKVKLLFDLLRLEESTSSLGQTVPREILDLIQSSIPQSPIVLASRNIMTGDSDTRRALIEKLKKQVDDVFEAVQKANEHFWPALIDDGGQYNEMPAAYSMGSVEEMKLVLHYNYDAWLETPGAIDWIASKYDGNH
jgi:uncharacterized protein YoxC